MNIAFFLYYRAGSSFFHNIINSVSDSGLKYLPTIPKNIYRVEYVTGPNLNLEEHTVRPIAVTTHVGNWWGSMPNNEIPEPLESPSPMKWSREELGKLSGEWKFVSLIRDGRNHVSSLINKGRGAIETELYKKNPRDYFERECIAFKNRARVALDCSKWSNYRIFRFEDLVDSPIETIMRMFSYLGLEGDEDYLLKKTAKVSESRKTSKHSSFSDDSKMHYRWHDWTSEQKTVFSKIAGKELIDLGYEKDNNW